MRLVLANATPIRRLHPDNRRGAARALMADVQAATDGNRLTVLAAARYSFPGKLLKRMVGAATIPADGRIFSALQQENSIIDMAAALAAEWEWLNAAPHPTGSPGTYLVAVVEAELLIRLARQYGHTVTEARAQRLPLLVIDTA